LLLQQGVPALERAAVTVSVGAVGLGVGVAAAVFRLRHGAGLITALVRRAGLGRFRIVDAQMDVLHASEDAAAALVGQAPRMFGAFVVGLLANLLVIAEFALLLSALGLPNDPIAIVAALFATAAAHMIPVPAGIGVLEGTQIWLFSMLGHSAEVGLAVGLAVRLRELIWMLPGLLYMLTGSLGASRKALRAA
jgi:uncharacterized membrane protein YbhN (UPF0104 family)